MVEGVAHAASAQVGAGRVVVIDRVRRATVMVLELTFSAEDVAASLSRPADFAGNQIVSWGGVTADDVRRLLEHAGDDDGQERWTELIAMRDERDLAIALVWRVET